MKVAVEGCCHGELDKIYETLAYIENKDQIKVDLLLICGDFQAVRNRSDLQAMAVPPKYQKLNTFYKYYAGEKTAPVMTIIIGGNHEASNYLQELPYGGWIAPNMYYLGYAGVVQFGGLRIGGLSGIFKGRDYNKGHFEHPPYSEDTKRSCYHVRSLEVFRLKQLKQPIDIMLSHDWPRGIYHHGNTAQLLNRKRHFREEVESNTLGSPAAEELLNTLQPAYWFSAHLHVKFPAIIDHQSQNGSEKQTKFLALDKCLPRRHFLQVLDLASPQDATMELQLDPEWLCVLKSTNHLLSLTKATRFMPGIGCSERYDFTVTEEEIKELKEDFGGIMKVPENFTRTVPIHCDSETKTRGPVPQIVINPQTTLLCDMLGLTDPFAVFSGKSSSDIYANQIEGSDSNDSLLEDNDDEGIHNDSDCIDTTMETSINTSVNPAEISLDDIDDIVEDSDRGESPGVSSLPDSDQAETSQLSSLPDVDESPKAVSLQEDLSPISAKLLNTSVDSEASLKRDLLDEDEQTGASSQEENVPNKTKKIKRRNQAIYESSEDC